MSYLFTTLVFMCVPLLLALGCRSAESGASEQREGPVVPSSAPSSGPPTQPDASAARQEKREMVEIAAGEYEVGVGKNHTLLDGITKRKVQIKSFWIDKAETSVEEYRRCVEAKQCGTQGLEENTHCNWTREDRQGHPINCLHFEQAAVFCAWRAARLPTEEEWEVASIVSDSEIAIGERSLEACLTAEYTSPLSHMNKAGTCVVGKHRKRTGKLGIVDMDGNVSEWTSSKFCDGKLKWCDSPTARGTAWVGDEYETLKQRWPGPKSGAPAVSRRRTEWMGVRCVSDSAP